MEIAAAAPQWPWSDIAYALAPNGRNLDYVTNSPYKGPTGKLPIGVWKSAGAKYLNEAGRTPQQLRTERPSKPTSPVWLLRFKAGDPYSDASINGIVEQLSTFHSSFGIDHSVEPSPLLIQSGWNDDLFPVDEALRYYQRTRAQYPGDPISLYLADIGHSRSQNKAGRRRRVQRTPRSVVRPLPEGRRRGAELERRSTDHDLSVLGGLRRPVQSGRLGRPPAG